MDYREQYDRYVAMIEETIETVRRYVLINNVRELRNTVERACVLRRYPQER